MEESVTLVTAKNQHRCWKARARTYVRRVSGEHLRIFGDEANEKLSLGLFSLRTCFLYFAHFRKQNRGAQKE